MAWKGNARPHKYGAKATWVDGIRFASKREARRYSELKMLEAVGEVSGLEIQPAYPIEMVNPANGEVIQCGVYRADFRYWSLPADGAETYPKARVVVEDVKGMRTDTYKLKKRLVEAQYGIQIQEIR